jgi:hypothetical protein
MESLHGLLPAHWDHEPIKITSRIKIKNGRLMERGLLKIGH